MAKTQKIPRFSQSTGFYFLKRRCCLCNRTIIGLIGDPQTTANAGGRLLTQPESPYTSADIFKNNN